MYIHPLNSIEIMKLSSKLSKMKKDKSVNLEINEIKLLKCLIDILEQNYNKMSRFEKYLDKPKENNGYYELISRDDDILKSEDLKTLLNYCVLYNIIDSVSYENETAQTRLYRILFNPIEE